MALLIGDDFRVDVLSTHERCMRPPQHLEVDPAETNLPQLINSTNVSTPGFGNTITGKHPRTIEKPTVPTVFHELGSDQQSATINLKR